jgi:hypothetical protein
VTSIDYRSAHEFQSILGQRMRGESRILIDLCIFLMSSCSLSTVIELSQLDFPSSSWRPLLYFDDLFTILSFSFVSFHQITTCSSTLDRGEKERQTEKCILHTTSRTREAVTKRREKRGVCATNTYAYQPRGSHPVEMLKNTDT